MLKALTRESGGTCAVPINTLKPTSKEELLSVYLPGRSASLCSTQSAYISTSTYIYFNVFLHVYHVYPYKFFYLYIPST